MMRLITCCTFILLVIAPAAVFALSGHVPPAPNGILMPEGYQDWHIIAPSYRSDNNTIRVILGNDIAVKAAQSQKTNPWPDGSILAKLVWEGQSHEKWSSATIPGKFIHVEFMVKDSKKNTDTGGWGFARWIGEKPWPYGKSREFVLECFGCHTPVKENDYVFTRPVTLPQKP